MVYFTDKKPFLRYCLKYHTPKIIFRHVKYYIENVGIAEDTPAKEWRKYFFLDRTKFVIVPQFNTSVTKNLLYM